MAAAAARRRGCCKADLTTEMVKEFTSLQGVIGGIYAREEARPEEVWQAIYDQYLPAASDDPIPRGRVGRPVALADRLDTLVGIFGLGLVPTGSRDPFGLRRAAQGVGAHPAGGRAAARPRAGRRPCRAALRRPAGARRRGGARRRCGRSSPTASATCWALAATAYDEIEAALARRRQQPAGPRVAGRSPPRAARGAGFLVDRPRRQAHRQHRHATRRRLRARGRRCSRSRRDRAAVRRARTAQAARSTRRSSSASTSARCAPSPRSPRRSTGSSSRCW